MARLAPVLALSLAACGGRAAAPPAALPPPPVDPGPAPAVPAEQRRDAGTFLISINGQAIGQERFEIVAQGDELVIRTESELALGAQRFRAKGELRADATWQPRGGRFTVEGDGKQAEVTLARDGDALTMTRTIAGEAPLAVPAQGAVDVFLLDNTVSHMTPLCASAGAAPRTVSAFPGLALAVEAAAPRAYPDPAAPDAPPRAFTLIVIDLAGQARYELLCEGAALVAVSLPLASFVAARDGYQAYAAAMARVERQKPPTPDDLVELPRQVAVAAGAGVAAATLDCSLMVPASHAAVTRRARRGPTAALPAVVFITGSGAQDRDEDTVGPGGLKLAIFKTVALRLARAGIASLRCDDRGTGKSTGDFATATLGTFVADARAQVAALRTEAAIDPARIGLVGHSEGGIIAPIVASRDAKLRAIVLMAGTGRPFEVILLEQLEAGLRRGGQPDAEIERRLAELRTLFAALRAGQPLPESTSPADRAAWSTPWVASHLSHDPVAVARGLRKTAVFVAQGERDAQVKVVDAEALREALARARNPNVLYKVYPDLNHLFAPTRTGSFADYSDPEAQVDPGFLDDVAGFLKARL